MQAGEGGQGSAHPVIASISVLSISKSKTPGELQVSKDGAGWLKAGLLLCRCRRFLEEAGKGKRRVKFWRKLISILETSVRLQNPWKTEQKNDRKVVNCRSIDLGFPHPCGCCRIINVYSAGI